MQVIKYCKMGKHVRLSVITIVFDKTRYAVYASKLLLDSSLKLLQNLELHGHTFFYYNKQSLEHKMVSVCYIRLFNNFLAFRLHENNLI